MDVADGDFGVDTHITPSIRYFEINGIVQIQLNTCVSRVAVEIWLHDPTATCASKVLTPTVTGKIFRLYLFLIY